ncbi:MAG TPA: DUF3782 domain-containing protein [Thermodesulfovibrionia bacterium]|nr:DUF3782 domain-containing protein [Thermodesulfovibrionia bacterium]
MTKQEMELGFQEIWKLFKETKQSFKETEQFIKETDQQLRASDLRLQKKMDELTNNVNALTGKWSKFVEGLVAPGAIRIFRERGINVKSVFQRVESQKDGKQMEIDVLAVDGEYAVLIEAKSTLSVDDVNEHLERIEAFKYFFPEYQDRKAVGAVAGIVIDKGAERYAYRKGFFVIAQSGETVKILNDEKFQPKTW